MRIPIPAAAICLDCDCFVDSLIQCDCGSTHLMNATNVVDRSGYEDALRSIRRRFAEADRGTLEIRASVAWAMDSDAREALEGTRPVSVLRWDETLPKVNR